MVGPALTYDLADQPFRGRFSVRPLLLLPHPSELPERARRFVFLSLRLVHLIFGHMFLFESHPAISQGTSRVALEIVGSRLSLFHIVRIEVYLRRL